MTSRFPSPASAAVVGVLAALGVIAWSGCGPGPESRYYCDDGGCYQCDAYGCSSVAAPTHDPCKGNVSCGAGQICTSNGCVPTCSDNDACPKGEVCKSGLCTAPGATPPSKKECESKAECGSGQVCISNVCQACGGSAGPCPCTDTKECAAGQACVSGACTDAKNTCKYSSECADGKVCADGECLVACNDNAPCTTGFACEKGVCQPVSSGVECKLDTECPAESPQCVGGSCVKSCATDPECGAGRFCDQGACVLDTRPSPNCTDDGQCGGTSSTPKKCLGGFCKYACTPTQGDAYCKTIDNRIGYCAKDGVCRSQQEASAACFIAADCGAGKSCIDNQCK